MRPRCLICAIIDRKNWEELESALSDAWRTPVATVIELVVNDTDGAQTLQQLLAQVSHL
ncbi:menaquinone biosynthesis protein [Salmonella bongori]|nr:menaquinone biosynthesis protein [Salmonella bongori]